MDENKASKFYDEEWDRWEDRVKYGPLSRHIRRLIMHMTKEIDFKSVVDIGCGEGSLLQLLELEGKYKLYGCDISKKAIELASTKVNGEFQELDIEKEYLNKNFDLAICSEVLEHIKDDRAAIKNIGKVAKYAIITVPTGEYGKKDKEVGHVRRYSDKKILEKLKQEGFNILKYRKWGFPFYSIVDRILMSKAPGALRTGKFGIFMKILSHFLYCIYLGNVFNKGNVMLILAKKR